MVDFEGFRSSRAGSVSKVTRPRVQRVGSAPSRSSRSKGLATSSSGDAPGRSRDWLAHVPAGQARRGRLRALFIGHNPSVASWDACLPYAHGSNMFWRLLRESALVGDGDVSTLPEDSADLAESRGIAFADLYVTPGSDAAKVRPKPGAMPVHENLVARMAAVLAEPPRAIVLVSKTVAEQFLRKKTAHFGKVAVSAELDVPAWLGDDTELWVLPSTSARAPMKWEKRLGPFKEFAAAIQKWPWLADSVCANRHPSPTSATTPIDDQPELCKMLTNG